MRGVPNTGCVGTELELVEEPVELEDDPVLEVELLDWLESLVDQCSKCCLRRLNRWKLWWGWCFRP